MAMDGDRRSGLLAGRIWIVRVPSPRPIKKRIADRCPVIVRPDIPTILFKKCRPVAMRMDARMNENQIAKDEITWAMGDLLKIGGRDLFLEMRSDL